MSYRKDDYPTTNPFEKMFYLTSCTKKNTINQSKTPNDDYLNEKSIFH